MKRKSDRSRFENQELKYTIRVGGRIWAAFRNEKDAMELTDMLGRMHVCELTNETGKVLLSKDPKRPPARYARQPSTLNLN